MTACSLSADGSVVVTCSGDNTAQLWDAGTGNCVSVLAGHVDGVGACSLSADCRLLATGGVDKMVRLWDVETCKGHNSRPAGYREKTTTCSLDLDKCRWPSAGHRVNMEIAALGCRHG